MFPIAPRWRRDSRTRWQQLHDGYKSKNIISDTTGKVHKKSKDVVENKKEKFSRKNEWIPFPVIFFYFLY